MATINQIITSSFQLMEGNAKGLIRNTSSISKIHQHIAVCLSFTGATSHVLPMKPQSLYEMFLENEATKEVLFGTSKEKNNNQRAFNKIIDALYKNRNAIDKNLFALNNNLQVLVKKLHALVKNMNAFQDYLPVFENNLYVFTKNLFAIKNNTLAFRKILQLISNNTHVFEKKGIHTQSCNQIMGYCRGSPEVFKG